MLVREVLLFCKKAAKNFFKSGRWRVAANASGPDSRKFLRRFFKKRLFPPGSFLEAIGQKISDFAPELASHHDR
jgi:hypothetical protein